jgi:hypothetical protein
VDGFRTGPIEKGKGKRKKIVKFNQNGEETVKFWLLKE